MIIEDQGYKVKVIADSISPAGVRLLSLECTYPRFIHSEMMTHRMFSRNSASSRAIPWAKMRQMILDNPVVPLSFGKEQKGMQSGDELTDNELNLAKEAWLFSRDKALFNADQLATLGVHKSIVNRLTEPFMWITVLISATDWKNFFKLRCHPDAEKHMQKIAYLMRTAHDESKPKLNDYWHLPYINEEDIEQTQLKLDHTETLIKVSTGRCARLSYLTQDGKRSLEKDVLLHDTLLSNGHWSPFEHPATPADSGTYYGNLRGWKPWRKFFMTENAENLC